MAEVYLWCNKVVANLPGVKDAVHDEAKSAYRSTVGVLEEVRATTPHHKIFGPGNLTYIKLTPDTSSTTDWFVHLCAPNPIAIEYGHEPSGVFGGTDTKSPDGLYILHQGTGLI
jgi:hypothetical protein